MRLPVRPRRARTSKYLLRLYINRATLKSRVAVENVQRVSRQHLNGRYHLEVIEDVLGPDLRVQGA